MPRKILWNSTGQPLQIKKDQGICYREGAIDMGPIGLNEVIDKHKTPGAAVAFNFVACEDLRGIITAAEVENVPVIVQVTQGAVNHCGIDYIAAMGVAAARTANVPVCLHLDHATDFATIVRAIRLGFSSVMIDASRLPFEQNIDATRKVVEVAHAAGVSVEAELGQLAGREDNVEGDENAWLTDPEEAEIFVAKTGIDALAPSVGTAHGLYKGTPSIRFDLIRAIADRIHVPLVLHGGSDVPIGMVQEAIRCGIRKFNVGTDLRIAQARALQNSLADKVEFSAADVFAAGQAVMDAVCAEARRKIHMCTDLQ